MSPIAGLWVVNPSKLASEKAAGETPLEICNTMLASFCDGMWSERQRAFLPSVRAPHPGMALGIVQPSGNSSSGTPAMTAPSTQTSLVAKARLDNREQLTVDLGIPSVDARALPDETLLLQAWQSWGKGCLDHLAGGFAFACWNAQARELFLARDHAGDYPLFFSSIPNEFFAFASMPRALRALPRIGSHLNVVRMAHFLGIVTPTGSETFFEGIERLLPGHAMTVTAEGVRIERYWHPADTTPIRYRRNDQYIEDFRERFDRAVSARLRSSVPIAAQLSGGLDSSSVAATAARLLDREGQRLTAFTAVPLPTFDRAALTGRFGDEGPAAADVAALYPNIDHVLVSSAGHDLFASTERAGRLADQPVFNPTNQLWVDAILDATAARGMQVLLQGVCGNATISFGGMIGLADLLRSGRWITLARQVRQLRSKGHTSWRGAASWATGGLAPTWMRKLMHPEMRTFNFSFSPVNPQRAAEYQLRERVLEEFYGADTSSNALRRKLYEYYDPGQLNAAALLGWGVENRDPTQDRRIFEFCFAIPVEQYLAEGQSRSLIRRAMRGRLPATTLERTTRGLQAADWHLVMGHQQPQMRAALEQIERSSLARHLLDVPRLRRLLDTWPQSLPSGGAERDAANQSYHLALSRGLSAGIFIQSFD